MADALDLNKLSDLELIRLRMIEKESVEVLVNRYKHLAKIKASKYYSRISDKDDFMQEAMIGIFEAVMEFDEGYNTSFQTFLNLVMDRKILNLLKKDDRKSEVPKDKFLYISRGDNEDYNASTIDESLLSIKGEENSNMLLNYEYVEALKEFIEKELSEFERTIFSYYVSGYKYEEMAKILSCDKKAIDNAIQRIRKKFG